MDPKDRRPAEFLVMARKGSPELAEVVARRLEDFGERYPDNAAINYYHAVSLWEGGGGEHGKNVDKIEALLRKVEVEDPEWYEPCFLIGILFQGEERYPEVILALQRTVKLQSDSVPAHCRLSTLFDQTGQRRLAARELATVQRMKNKELKDDPGESSGK